MKYYSTNKTAPKASLEDAVIHGLAPDRGLYMPEEIQKLPAEFFQQLDQLSLQEIAYTVANSLFGKDIAADVLHT
ncbi:MAG: threonine synthase, partial [Prevotella salivae]|nr:threonine synthase [Segatella salivae]